MAKGEETLQAIRVLMKNLASDVGLRFDKTLGASFRCTMRSQTAIHRFHFDGADLKAFQANRAVRNKIKKRLEDELDCLRMKEKIKQAAAPLYPDQELEFGRYDRNGEVRVEVAPPRTGSIYWAMGADELTALEKLHTKIKRAARMCSP